VLAGDHVAILSRLAEKLLSLFLPLETDAVVQLGEALEPTASSEKDAEDAPAQQEEPPQPEGDHDQRTMAMSF
jgi:hypothetical protein